MSEADMDPFPRHPSWVSIKFLLYIKVWWAHVGFINATLTWTPWICSNKPKSNTKSHRGKYSAAFNSTTYVLESKMKWEWTVVLKIAHKQHRSMEKATTQQFNRGCLLLKLLCAFQDSGLLSANGFLLENVSDDIRVVWKIKSKIPAQVAPL